MPRKSRKRQSGFENFLREAGAEVSAVGGSTKDMFFTAQGRAAAKAKFDRLSPAEAIGYSLAPAPSVSVGTRVAIASSGRRRAINAPAAVSVASSSTETRLALSAVPQNDLALVRAGDMCNVLFDI